MNKAKFLTILLFAAGTAGTTLSAQEPDNAEVRTIRLLQDDAQLNIVSKIYELKHVKATDIRPFIEAAVKRYHRKSKVERVVYTKDGQNYLTHLSHSKKMEIFF